MTRAGRRAVAAALLLTVAGCAVANMDTSLPASVPAYRYETPRAVVDAIPRDQARRILSEALGRSFTPTGDRLASSVGEARFAFRWAMNVSAARSNTGHKQAHEFDFAFAEVTPVIVDLTSVGGRQGVKLQRGGVDVPHAYFLTATLDDAERIFDALTILGRPGS